MAIGGGRTVEEERAYYEDVPVYASLNNADTNKRARVGNTIYEFDRGSGGKEGGGGAGWVAIRTSPEGTYPTGTATDNTSMGSILDSLLGGQVTSGITATGGITDPNYTAQGEYFVGPTYTGPMVDAEGKPLTDPYVMQSGTGPAWDYKYPTNLGAGTYGYGTGTGTGTGTGNTIADMISSILGGGTSAGGTTVGGAGTTKYPGVIPGSDKEQDLDAGRTHHVEMYDVNDMWVGAEGTPGIYGGTRGLLGATQDSTGRITGRSYTGGRVFDPNDPLGYSPTGRTAEDIAAKALQDKLGYMTGVTTAVASPPQLDRIMAQNVAEIQAQNQAQEQARVRNIANKQGQERVFSQQQAAQAQEQARVRNILSKQAEETAFSQQQAAAQARIQATEEARVRNIANKQAEEAAFSRQQAEAAAAQIAAAKARWAGMDDSTQRTMMASAGKPDMGAMLEAMARQQAAANLSAAGGMEMGGGGLLGEVDVAGGTGQRGMFGGEVGYGPGR